MAWWVVFKSNNLSAISGHDDWYIVFISFILIVLSASVFLADCVKSLLFNDLHPDATSQFHFTINHYSEAHFKNVVMSIHNTMSIFCFFKSELISTIDNPLFSRNVYINHWSFSTTILFSVIYIFHWEMMDLLNAKIKPIWLLIINHIANVKLFDSHIQWGV